MIAERVRLAREACRMTQHELADASGVAFGTLSAIEGAHMNPSDETIAKIAAATSFPPSFFYLGPLPDLPEGYYRKLKRGSAKDAKRMRAQVRQVVELVQRSEKHVRLPDATIEPLRDLQSLDHLEGVAQGVRRRLGLGHDDPIPNLMRAVERAGVVIVRLPTELPNHDSYSVWPDFGLDGRPLIALTAGHAGDRDRSNTAHELGHLVLHTKRPDLESDEAEAEAKRFAGALLLPEDAAREAMRPPITLRLLMGVKARFGVSIALGIERARELHLITKEQHLSMRKQLSTRGWLRVEPVTVTPESPQLISKIVGIVAGGGSTTDRASRVHMPAFAFRAIAS